jgi:hypothetical protein
MAPVRVDVSLRRRIHFHGFGVARQGPWCTVEKVDIELIATTNRDRNAPRSAYSVPTLGPMRAPREFFNRLTPSTHFGE